MKLNPEQIQQLQDILFVCSICNIESIIIENEVVRGVSDTKTCAIICNEKVPKFTQRVGLSRLSSLKSRLELFPAQNLTIDAKETERGEISTLDISSGKNKVQFRCTSTALIKAPQQINDIASSVVYLKKPEVKLILDAIRVMGAKRIILNIRNNIATFECADATNDVFKCEIEAPVTFVDEADSSVHYYPADVFSAIVKTNAAGSTTSELVELSIGQHGVMNISVNGYVTTILPQMNED